MAKLVSARGKTHDTRQQLNPMNPPIITLTTDFGLHDGYVGAMKGSILGICPTAHIVDITHAIAPQRVTEAALVLQSVVPYYPPGTVHLVVVDPGVGSERHPLALATPQACYVGPDNGVFSLVWREALAQWSPAEVRVVVLHERRFWLPQVSATFHGRDLFAPVAAHLAIGVALEEFGPPLDAPMLLDIAEPAWDGDGRDCLVGQVLAIDHFGNAITNITTTHLQTIAPRDRLSVSISGEKTDQPIVANPTRLPVCSTYADVAPGAILALVGSAGRLEIAQRNGNASETLGIRHGYVVRVCHEQIISDHLPAHAPR
jgi:S-adenosyl-L-methionine hydrolase (adenosine-forming)